MKSVGHVALAVQGPKLVGNCRSLGELFFEGGLSLTNTTLTLHLQVCCVLGHCFCVIILRCLKHTCFPVIYSVTF